MLMQTYSMVIGALSVTISKRQLNPSISSSSSNSSSTSTSSSSRNRMSGSIIIPNDI
jgi:hypothetical protein